MDRIPLRHFRRNDTGPLMNLGDHRQDIVKANEHLGWEGNELLQHRKGDVDKVQVALRLRRETTMSMKWIARELRMGSWTYVANLLGQTKSLSSNA